MSAFLAPMAGYTDRIFRDICRDFGADIVFTEMANCHLFKIFPERAWELLGTEDERKPLAVQLFGNKPELLAHAASMLEEGGVKYIDLNAGCPVRKVVKTGSGSALMKDLGLFAAIIKAMRAAVKRSVLSVKIRSGWNAFSLNYLEAGYAAQEEGIDRVTLHARTREQGFTGKADWEHIARLKEKLMIPVTGNGDLKTLSDVKRMKAETGVEDVMLGRGALSRPQIFREIAEDKEIELPLEQVKSIILKLYEGKTGLHGEKKGVLEMRKVVPFLVKGWHNAKEVRMMANKAGNMDRVREIFS